MATTPLVLLAKPRFSAQRICDSYVELTRLLRSRASDPSRLWLFAVTSGGGQIDVRTLTANTRQFTRWVHEVGLLDVDQVHSVDQARAERITLPAGRRGRHASSRLRTLEAWSGPVDPRRIRKTDKARRIVMGGLAAANDHTVRVLILHYTNSDLVRVRSSLIINEVADTLVAFASGPRPATVVAPDVAADALDGANASATLRRTAQHQRGTAPRPLARSPQHRRRRLHRSPRRRHTTNPASSAVEPGATCACRARRRSSCTTTCRACGPRLSVWRIAATMTGDTFAELHGDHHALLLDLLTCFAPGSVNAYRERGTIPTTHGAAPAPARLQRRRARR